MTDADKRYENMAEQLIAEHDLAPDRRMGIITGSNIGDNYFLLSAIPYVEQLLKMEFIVISRDTDPITQYVKLFNDNGCNIRRINAGNLIDVYYRASDALRNKYGKSITNLLSKWTPPKLLHFKTTDDVKHNLARPKYPTRVLQSKYPNLRIDNEHSIFIIDSAHYHGTLGFEYWRSVISIFSALGYTIIVNSKTDKHYGKGVQYVFPDVQDIVPICDECGTVFSIRTGLIEVVAPETKAKVIVTGWIGDIERIYPFMPKDKIAFLPLENIRGTGFSEFDRRERHVTATHAPAFLYCSMNANLKAKNKAERYDAKITTSNLGTRYKPFDRISWGFVADFCKIKYSIVYDKGYCLCTLSFDPENNYEAHARLIDEVGINQTTPIADLLHIQNNTAIFKIPYSGVFFIYFKVYHPSCRLCCEFTTRRFAVSVDIIASVTDCTVLKHYIRLLCQIAKDAIIFISSRDAHTNWKLTQKLFLEELNLKLQPEKKMRYSYLAIIDAGEVMLEQESKDQELQAQYDFDGNRAELVSAGYNVNMNDKTSISIKINGIEYAVDRRGLNFVIWSKRDNRVIDSVAFDTFLESSPCFRKRV